MPTYEYVCTQCGNRLEIVQRLEEESPTECEVCGGALRKVFHPVGVVLKGSGFYKTDSRSSSSSPSKEKPKEGSKEKPTGSAKEPKDTKETKSDTSKPVSKEKKT